MIHIDDPATRKANLRFIKASMRQPLLSREHEHDLAVRWRDQGDERALHALVRAYTRLVVAQAARFRSYGLPAGDLVQEGNVGLMMAAARFDPGRDVRFSTYATWWVRSTMQDYVLRNWSIVRTGTTAAQKALFFNFHRLRAQIAADSREAALSPEARRRIAEQLKVDDQDVSHMERRLAGADRSLNVAVGESGTEMQDLVADSRPSPEDVVIGMRDARTRSRWLAEALDCLSPRERAIIAQRRLAEQGATLEEIGRTLGVSKERVRQLENRALGKLRQLMLRRAAGPADRPCAG
jgi:RNA polymerase sigma-32 factor